MTVTTYRQVLDRLVATKGKWPMVAKDSGVPLRTLRKIASGEIANPGVAHIERLSRYFQQQS